MTAPAPHNESSAPAASGTTNARGLLQWVRAAQWLPAGQRLRGLLDWLYPVRCLHCGCALLGWHSPGLCANCEKEIVWLDNSACRRCGSYLEACASASGHDTVAVAGSDAAAMMEDTCAPECSAFCAHCAGQAWRYTRAAGVVRYKAPGRALMHDFKYQGNRALAERLAAQMLHRLRDCGFPLSYDLILPVPLHPKRLRIRGYNQSLLLAQGVARGVQGELRPDLLRRVRFTQAQALTAPDQRAKNIAGAFRAIPAALTDKTVLLIDDVMTTGATVNECALELRNAGAKRIYVLVWAR